MSSARLVAVLGYSEARREGLHPVCAARLERAHQETRPDDVVLLSGWARRGSAGAEADLMLRGWRVPARKLLLDRSARSTAGNVIGIARAARALGAAEVVLVTSSWHGRRAQALLRSALRGTGTTVRLAASTDPPSTRARLRELACWPVTPLLALAAARAR